MGVRGPRSVAELVVSPRVDGRPARLPVPAGMSEAAEGVWGLIVGSCAPEHFRPSDAPLLRSFCEVTIQADVVAGELAEAGAVIGGKINPWLVAWERALHAQLGLATKLRLCPSSRSDPRTVARQKPRGPVLWAQPWSEQREREQ